MQIEGKLVAPNMESWSGDKNIWISFDHVKGLVVNGGGIVDGQGSSWWKACGGKVLKLYDLSLSLSLYIYIFLIHLQNS